MVIHQSPCKFAPCPPGLVPPLHDHPIFLRDSLTWLQIMLLRRMQISDAEQNPPGGTFIPLFVPVRPRDKTRFGSTAQCTPRLHGVVCMLSSDASRAIKALIKGRSMTGGRVFKGRMYLLTPWSNWRDRERKPIRAAG
jgi:hypothetical protein